MSVEDFTNYYAHQCQTGQCGSGMPYYVGRRHQRGHGIGGFLSSALKSLLPNILPMAKSVAKSFIGNVAQSAANQGVGFVKDVMGGVNPRNAAIHRAGQTFKTAGKRTYHTYKDVFDGYDDDDDDEVQKPKRSRMSNTSNFGVERRRPRGRPRGRGRGRGGRGYHADIFS